VCFSVFGVEAIVYPGMSLAGDVDLTISPLPRTVASCTTHWRLPRRFQSVVNPTRIATSSFVGHFSGRRARARERATRHRAAGTRNRMGQLWRTRCQSCDISLLRAYSANADAGYELRVDGGRMSACIRTCLRERGGFNETRRMCVAHVALCAVKLNHVAPAR